MDRLSIPMSFDREADACYIYLKREPRPVYRRQVVTEFKGFELVVDLDQDGRLGGIEIIGASRALPEEMLE